jgi:hypothetical protein
MMRLCFSLAAILLAFTLCRPASTSAQTDSAEKKPAKARIAKTKADNDPAAGDGAGPKPLLVGTYGDWGAYQTQVAKGKICYALARPKQREPGNLNRDPAYVFIATRPAEGVQNEISFMMGFPLKEGTIDSGADIDGSKFDLIAKGQDAWVKNAAQESQVIEAMRKGTTLVIKAASKKGNVTTDSYSLAGVSQALDRVAKNCQ